jgi:hypothetical protein
MSAVVIQGLYSTKLLTQGYGPIVSPPGLRSTLRLIDTRDTLRATDARDTLRAIDTRDTLRVNAE